MSPNSEQTQPWRKHSLEPGVWFGRISRVDHDQPQGISLLIDDAEYFVPISSVYSTHAQRESSRNGWIEGSWVRVTVKSGGRHDLHLIQRPLKPPSPYGDMLRWRSPLNSPSRMKILKQRHRLLLEVRKWFDAQGFFETETPLLVRAPSPEPQFSLMQVFEEQADEKTAERKAEYLITSPEFQMKRLLVGGFERIFQICRCFRGKEFGDLHNPEFTMLEWYRAHSSLKQLTEDLAELCFHLTEIFPGMPKVPQGPWPLTVVRDLFGNRLGVDLSGLETPEELLEKALEAGHGCWVKDLVSNSINVTELTYEMIFSRLWNRIEPELGRESPLWVHEWPLPLACLARSLPNQPGFADRVECYVNGMELANGFGELTDPIEQRRRFEKDLRLRGKMGRIHVPLDLCFLESLEEGMPPSSGMALGLDRLVLWLTEAKKIEDVLCFSWPER